MPRSSDIYTVPVGTDGVPGTTISSTAYNTFVHDVETDLNTPRPIIAGGTGANNAAQARTNLGIASAGLINCGRLTMVNQDLLKFSPFNGDKIKINGVIYDIPAAGIAGLANTNISINGTAGQTLTQATYLVTARIVGGVVTADYLTIPTGTTYHMADTTAGNVGVQVYTSNGTTPDSTRTVIGLVFPIGGKFTNNNYRRLVRSWFNRVPVRCHLVIANDRTTTSSTLVQTGDYCDFVIWKDETFHCSITATMTNSTNSFGYLYVAIDDSTITGFYFSQTAGVTYNVHVSGQTNIANTDSGQGYHWLSPYFATSAGTQYIMGNYSVMHVIG